MNNKNTLTNLIKQSISFRGQVISKISALEVAMNLFLAKHFCETDIKQTEILESIFATKKMAYADKVDTVSYILNKYHKDFIKQYPYITKTQLIKFGEHRNTIAHCFLNTEESAIKTFIESDTISFLKYQNSKEPIKYNNVEAKKLFDAIDKITKDILTLV